MPGIVVTTYKQTAPAIPPSWQLRNGIYYGDNYTRGTSVDMDNAGTTMISGAPNEWATLNDAGAAYIYTRTTGAWGNEYRIESPTPRTVGPFGGFGRSVAISGDGLTVAVGDIVPSPTVGFPSKIHIFTWSGSSWDWQQEIDFPDLSYEDDLFANHQVRLSDNGDVMIVGATRYNGTRGGAYVYKRSGGTYTLNGTLVPSGTHSPGDEFGWCVDVSGDGTTVAFGSWRRTTQTGMIAVFKDSSGWVEEGVFTGPGATTWAFFGWAVSLSADGNLMAVGARGFQTSPGVYSGAVQTFVRSGSSWSFQETVKYSLAVDGDYYGASVKLNSAGDAMIVGAPFYQGYNAFGSAHLYNFTGGTWVEDSYLFQADFPDYAQNFGQSVAISDNALEVIVGSPSYYNPGGAGGTFAFGYF